MARYTVTLVFAVGADTKGPGTNPWASDALAKLRLPALATHLRTSCDDSTVTVVADFRSSRPASVCRELADAARSAWAEVSGADPGDPTSVRVRPLRPPHPVSGDAGSSREYEWHREGDGDGRLVLVDAGSDPTSAPNDVEHAEQVEDAEQVEHAEPAEHVLGTHSGRRRRAAGGRGHFRIAIPLLPRRHRH
jgi:hypothetical protein